MRKIMTVLGCSVGLLALSGQTMAEKPKAPEVVPVNIEVLSSKPVKRMVVMDFGALDTLDALGVSDRVVALPKGNLPEYLSQYNKDVYANSGGMKTPDLSLLAEAKPDVIVMSGRQNSVYKEMTEIAPTIKYSLDSKNYLVSAQAEISMLGQLVNQQPLAKQKWQALEKELVDIGKLVNGSPLKASVVLHNAGKMMVVDKGNYGIFIHDVLQVKSADTEIPEGRVSADADYFKRINPDVIFIVDRSAAIGQPALNMDFFNQKAMKDISAVKQQRVISLTPKLWYLSGGGLQSLSLQAQEVASVFKK